MGVFGVPLKYTLLWIKPGAEGVFWVYKVYP